MGEQGQEVPITTTPPPGPVASVNGATTPHRFYVHHEPKKNIYFKYVGGIVTDGADSPAAAG